MKIKRFEASSMSDALRMVKKEFGEEAVILSAKNMGKSSRLFGKRVGGKVIVTAAIDETPHPAGTAANDASVQWTLPDLSTALQSSASQKSSEANSSILERFTPITRTGKEKLHPKLVRLMTESKQPLEPVTETVDTIIYSTLREQGLDDSLAKDLAARSAEVLPPDSPEKELIEALAQVIQTKEWVAPVATRRPRRQRTIVLVGPNGSGKTTTAAKLAARAILESEQTVGILSLDNQRVAGTDELARLAGIMGLELETATDPQQVTAVMDRLAETQLIVVDTPGLAPDDLEGRGMLERMIAAMTDPEVHLLLSAGCQEQVISKMVDFYHSLGVNRVLPTHLDWTDCIGPFINQISRHRLSMSYMGSGARVPEDLHAATDRELAMRLLALESLQDQDSPQGPGVTVVQRRKPGSHTGPQYVANRNSDIFHQTDCKSVQRISEANALIFQDANDALAQGFKPCRMCCSEHIVLKPIDRLARTRYAGSRN